MLPRPLAPPLQVEGYSQQLVQRAKELEANPRGEELYHTPRYNSSQYNTFKGDSLCESTCACMSITCQSSIWPCTCHVTITCTCSDQRVAGTQILH